LRITLVVYQESLHFISSYLTSDDFFIVMSDDGPKVPKHVAYM